MYISATVPSRHGVGVSNFLLVLVPSPWSDLVPGPWFVKSLRGAQGPGLRGARDCFSHVFLVSFLSAFRTSIFRDLRSQGRDLDTKMTPKSEPGGTPTTTKNRSRLKN